MMLTKEIKAAIVVIITIIGFVIFFGIKSGIFSPGKYVNAEEYEVNQPIEKLILALNKFKNAHHNYVPPLELNLNDRIEDNNTRYHIYLYYEEEREVIYFWFRRIDNKNTKVALIAVAKAQAIIGPWKDINKDLDKEHNEIEKARFKYRILDRIIELVE